MACCFSARYYKCLAWSVSQHEMHLRPLGLVTSSVFKMGLYRSKHELYDVKKQHPFYEYMQTFSIQLLSAINEVAWRTVSWQNAGQPWGHSCHLKRSQSAIHECIGLIFPLFYCFLGIYPIFCLSTVLFLFFHSEQTMQKVISLISSPRSGYFLSMFVDAGIAALKISWPSQKNKKTQLHIYAVSALKNIFTILYADTAFYTDQWPSSLIYHSWLVCIRYASVIWLYHAEYGLVGAYQAY